MPDPLGSHAVVRRAIEFVGHAHGVEHAPEDIQLELQDFQHALLAGRGRVVLQRDRQAVLDVAARLAQAGAEVFVAGGVDPGVVLGPAVEA